MLILARVAISAVVDADGLFAKTRNVANIYELEAENEAEIINNFMNKVDKYMIETPEIPSEPVDLAMVAKVGDYVEYSANGYNKWRILNINDGVVSIVAEGCPELYYHASNSNTSIAALNTLSEKYLDLLYATTARSMNEADYNATSDSVKYDVGVLEGTTDNVQRYWLAKYYDSRTIRMVDVTNKSIGGWFEKKYGFRPVVVLKRGITAFTQKNNDNKWVLQPDYRVNLSLVAKVGDYVEYSVNNYDKWRILSINSGIVSIVSEGCPELYYHASNSNASIAALNTLAQNYLNVRYATTARSMNEADYNATSDSVKYDVGVLEGTTDNVQRYWLAKYYDSRTIRMVDVTNKSIGGWFEKKYGFRPVVVLKNGILTDYNKLNGKWVLYE